MRRIDHEHAAGRQALALAGLQVFLADVQRGVQPRALRLVAQGLEAPGQIVRSKVHPNTPRSVDDALSEMELVGHDFYLFINEKTNRPAVVYRRHAYDYGLIELAPEGETN